MVSELIGKTVKVHREGHSLGPEKGSGVTTVAANQPGSLIGLGDIYVLVESLDTGQP